MVYGQKGVPAQVLIRGRPLCIMDSPNTTPISLFFAVDVLPHEHEIRKVNVITTASEILVLAQGLCKLNEAMCLEQWNCKD